MTDRDDLSEIQAELEADGVYVHPRLEGLVDSDAEAALESQVADSEASIYLVVFPFSRNDAYGGEASDLLTRLPRRAGNSQRCWDTITALVPGSRASKTWATSPG